jgi:uncharacterized protein with ParB-like and HNH nuclease domain
MALQNILKLLSNDSLNINIPNYQRGYSWGETQQQDLFEDINNIMINRKHYIGFLTIKKNKDKYDLVDGQQRLTSIFILLATISKHHKANNSLKTKCLQLIQQENIDIYRLQYADEKMNSILHAVLANENVLDVKSVYAKNLIASKEFFSNKFNDFTNSDLETFFNKITQNLFFNLYDVEDEMDTFLIFEAMNNRGKPLSSLELLKNRLMFLVNMFQQGNEEKEENYNIIDENWAKIYEILGYEDNLANSDDIFLRHHTFIAFGFMDKTSDAYSNYLFREHFISQNNKVGLGSIVNYAENIGKSVSYWFSIKYPHSQYSVVRSRELRKVLTKIEDLKREHFSIILLSLFMAGYSESEILEIAKRIERFCFVVYNIYDKSIDYSRNWAYGQANAIYKKETNLVQLVNEMEIRFNKASKEEKNGIEIGIENFTKKIAKLKQQQNNIFWIGFNKIEYLLKEYEEYLRGETQNEVSINDFVPLYQPNWQGNEYSTHIEYSLGNLVAVCEGNRYFASFASVAQNKNISYSEKNIFDTYSEWNEANIIDRGISILKFIERRWDISLGNDDFKKTLLIP